MTSRRTGRKALALLLAMLMLLSLLPVSALAGDLFEEEPSVEEPAEELFFEEPQQEEAQEEIIEEAPAEQQEEPSYVEDAAPVEEPQPEAAPEAPAEAAAAPAAAPAEVTEGEQLSMSDSETFEADITIVKFNNHDWYIIADDSTATGGTVTLLAADTSFGTSKFHDSSNAYSSSTVNSKLVALTAEGGAFASVKDAIVNTNLTDVGVTGAKLYLLSTSEAQQLSSNVLKMNFSSMMGGWWLRSPGYYVYFAAFVLG